MLRRLNPSYVTALSLRFRRSPRRTRRLVGSLRCSMPCSMPCSRRGIAPLGAIGGRSDKLVVAAFPALKHGSTGRNEEDGP